MWSRGVLISPVVVAGTLLTLAVAAQRVRPVSDGGAAVAAQTSDSGQVGECRGAYEAAIHAVEDQRAPAYSITEQDEGELSRFWLALQRADLWLGGQSLVPDPKVSPKVVGAFCTPELKGQVQARLAGLRARRLLVTEDERKADGAEQTDALLREAEENLRRALTERGGKEPSR